MEKEISLKDCPKICQLACDIEGDVRYLRAYNREIGERVGGDSLALDMSRDMGVHSADRQKIVYFTGWKTNR